mgnify:CR=1 FL=1
MGLGEEHLGVAVEQTLIGVDPGEKRTGLAIKPAGQRAAVPLQVIDPSTAAKTILKLAQEHDADTVIVGLPRDINGNDTAQTAKARAFAGDLADDTGLHIVMHDEFSTSQRARDRLQATTREQEKRQLDAVAAAILLEDYIESMV